jgi:L-asparaginase II
VRLPVEDFTRGLVPLWAGRRGESVDFVRLGAFALSDADGRLLACCGDANLNAVLRSSAKPFQAVAFLRRGLHERLDLGDDEIACACASHSGEDRHVEAARRILSAAGLDEASLLCGTHEAVWPELQRRLRAGETELAPIHNNCSGKHAAMLAVCSHEGWEHGDYTGRDHPLQRENLQTLAAFAGVAPESVGVARDNCTVPTFALPLKDAARAAARLRDPRGLPEALGEASLRATAAMAASPGLVGGEERLDTAIMEATEGRVVVKTGANGYYLGSVAPEGGSAGRGFAMKLSGAEGDAQKAPAVLGALHAAGLLEDDEHASLGAAFVKPLLSCRGHDVGEQGFVGHVVRA